MFDKIFGVDGLLYRILNKLVDLLLLNVVFLFTCIPVFTIGCAVTALYGTTRSMVKEEGYLIKGYLKKFKENFKKATIVWLVMLAVLLVLAADFWILGGGRLGSLRWVKGILMAVLVLWFMIFSYVFPLMSKFENTVKNSVMNALIISMTRIIFTVPLLLLNILPAAICLIGGKVLLYGITFYLAVGYSATAYINTYILEHVFKKYIKE